LKALTYDVHPKHILDVHGFSWEKVSNIKCRCGHDQSTHLDSSGICLDKESKVDLTGTCICEEFISPNQTISIDVQKKKDMKEQTTDIIVKDDKITQDDQGKFLKQYGIM
jgi:hypothetical protein